MVGCSQCGTRFAGGNEGYSLCRNHQHRRGLTDREIDAMTAHAAAIKRENDDYTQGRLVVQVAPSEPAAYLVNDKRQAVARVIDTNLEGRFEINARRLAACWNACAGIPTAALELCGTCIDTPEQGEPL